VTKFVENLKGELESTFKEDISIYFDENPHDRLQETHNVDKSLEGKLKCLIFIPILSQTYCDPNSYAWQYEFLAFIKLTNEDQFGKYVRLKIGNVASRILPIRIHDLEQEDIKLFEKETRSVLRAMDFVFKTSAGVNRPLKASEDHPNDNLNKTFYSDQINKVAHAIKEIIQGMKAEPQKELKETAQLSEPAKKISKDVASESHEKPAKAIKNRWLSAIAIAGILIIVTIMAYPKIFKRDTLEKLRSSGERISVAVMPFQNMTNDTIWNVWQVGIQNEMITSLTNSEELKVRQTESINNLIQSKGLTNYASLTPSVASTISQKLDANIFVYGSIKQAGKTIRVNAQLIDSKTEDVFKSFYKDGTEENILYITDSLSVMVRDFILITILEKDIIKDFRPLISTNSSKAYRYYMYGNQAFYKYDYPTSSEWYRKAIDKDTNFTEAIRMLVYSLNHQGLEEESTKWLLKHYQKRDQMPEQEKIWSNILYAQYFETPDEVIKYFKLLVAYDDEMPVPHSNLGVTYYGLGLYDLAITEGEKELEIYKKWGSKPRWGVSFSSLGNAYHKMGMYKKEMELYKKAEQDFPDDPDIIDNQAALSFTLGDTIEANRYIEKYVTIRKKRSASEADIRTGLVWIYTEGGVLDKAEAIHREALSLEPENPERLNNLAYFLIDKDRNVSEGLELVERALKSQPDNFNYLHCKGWGLYKQGKYQEALDVLQKSWDIRRVKAMYNHEAYLHLQAAKKAVANQKKN
jgi:tetratricopeptide (TPR) repeat protein